MTQNRNTKQRRLVLEAVKSHTNHPSADEIYLDVREKDDKISRGTVYRNLNILAEKGDICHVKVPAADRYDFRVDRHYHLFCTACGAVFDAPIAYQEQYDKQVEQQTGFHIDRHRMIFEGLCAACQSKKQKEK